MSWGWRKQFKLGPLTLNLSRQGVSVGGKRGRFSTNRRTRRLRASLPFGGWWHSRSLSRQTRKPAAVVMACLQLETSPELFDAEEAVYVRPAKREEPRWIIFTEARLG
jgi:hypothetical protein